MSTELRGTLYRQAIMSGIYCIYLQLIRMIVLAPRLNESEKATKTLQSTYTMKNQSLFVRSEFFPRECDGRKRCCQPVPNRPCPADDEILSQPPGARGLQELVEWRIGGGKVETLLQQQQEELPVLLRLETREREREREKGKMDGRGWGMQCTTYTRHSQDTK